MDPEDSELKALKMCLHWPDTLKKYTHFDAGARRTCPQEHSLPIWKNQPLEKKLPVVPIPPNTAYFSRGKPGEGMIPKERAHEMRLSEGFQLPYDPIHDPHLLPHFKKRSVRQFLKKTGLVHKDGDAIASIKELNDYRVYRRYMNLDQVRYNLKMDTDLEQEKRQLQVLEEKIKKKKGQWELEQRLQESTAERREMKKRKEIEKMARWAQNDRIREAKVRKLQRKLEELQREKIMKSATKLLKNNRNLAVVAARQRVKLLGQIHKMRQREENQRKKRALSVQQQAEIKLEKIKRNWQRKITEMQQSDAFSRVLLEDVKIAHQANIENRMQKAQKMKEKQEAFTEELRIKRAKKRELMQKKLQEEKIKEHLLAYYSKSDDGKALDFYIRRSLNTMHYEFARKSSLGNDGYLKMLRCKEGLEKEITIPPEVTYIVDLLLERSIETWAKKILLPLIIEARKTVLNHGKAMLYAFRATRLKKIKKIETPRSKIVMDRPLFANKNFESKRSFVEEYLKQIEIQQIKEDEPVQKARKALFVGNEDDDSENQRPSNLKKSLGQVTCSSVRFGDVKEILVEMPPNVRLKSVVGRRMTPVPSYEDLAALAFTDPSLPSKKKGKFLFREKKILEKELNQSVKHMVDYAKSVMEDCIEPTTRARTVKKLAPIEDRTIEDLTASLAREILEGQGKGLAKEELRQHKKVAMGVVRAAVLEIFNPDEFRSKPNDVYIDMYRIMFYVPKNTNI